MNFIELFKRTVPLLCVIAYFGKLIYSSATLPDALVLLILSSLVAYLEWKLDKAEILKQLSHLKAIEQKIEDLDKKVSTVKLAQNFSNISGVRKP